MEPLHPNYEADVRIQDETANNAAYMQPMQTVVNNMESHAMLAMENDHICYIENCNKKGVQQCAGLRITCFNWMCDNHGVIAYRQHWCGGGGCGLRDHDKYCQFCAKKANRESWMKLALILSVLIFIIIILITHYM